MKELAKIALLGTDRADFSDELKIFLEKQGIDLDADATQILLEAAAISAQREKAGFTLKKITSSLPKPADDTDEYACSDNSAHHLQQILQGKFRFALSEFIEYLTENKKQVPPEMLPNIIESRLQAGDNWEKLRSIIGKRGEWLMRQNPTWYKVLPLEDPELWATGNREERLSVLRYLRSKFPDLVTEMLAHSWKTEITKDKIEFLAVLKENISVNDEPFLESCLDEKSVEIRTTAAALLSRIPSSQFVQRLSDRLKNLVYFENNTLIVKLPDAPDDAGIRDGLFGKIKVEKQGLRAAWLTQLIAFLPPKILEKQLNHSPFEILEFFLNSDFIQVLLGASLSSTISLPDTNWAEAFLRLSIEKSTTLTLPKEDLKSLVKLISSEQYNHILRDYLSDYSIIDSNSPLAAIILASSHRLASDNTRAMVRQYQQMISRTSYGYGGNFAQKKLLEILAYQCDFSILEELKKGWDMNAPLWRTWTDEVEKFVRILQFRKVMWEGLQL